MNDVSGGLYAGGGAGVGFKGAGSGGLGGCLTGGGTGCGGGVVHDTKIAAAGSRLKRLNIFLNILSSYYFNYPINMMLQRQIFKPDTGMTANELPPFSLALPGIAPAFS